MKPIKFSIVGKISLALVLIVLITSWIKKEAPLKSSPTRYGMMIPQDRVPGTQITLQIDTGKGLEYAKDREGNKRLYTTEVQALNSMALLGWEIKFVNKRYINSSESICYILGK
jgi:hypothetical protein